MKKIVLLSIMTVSIFASLQVEASERCATILNRLSNRQLYTGSYSKLKKFPRDPENFIYWWRMLDYVKTAGGVAVDNPFTQSEIAKLQDSFLKEMKRIGKAKKDMFAVASIPHIEEHLTFADTFRGHIESMGIDGDYYKTLALLHDAGKFLPDPKVLQLADGNFLMGRVAWHDQSTANYLIDFGKKERIDSAKIEHLLSDIVGHNDGAGIEGSFWVSVFPNYGMPRRLEGDILAMFDRFGQGNWIGAEKITRQVSTSKSFKDAVIEGYFNNPTMTIRQLDAIYERAQSRLSQRAIGVASKAQANLSEIYDFAVSAQQETIRGFKRMRWNNTKQWFSITRNGTKYTASSYDEFFSDAFQAALKNL